MGLKARPWAGHLLAAPSRWAGLAWMLLLSAAAVVCAGHSPALAAENAALGANLLKNPGFEETAPSSFAALWGGGEFGKPGDNVARDTQVKRSGEASLRLGFTPNGFVTCVSEKILLKANSSYGIIWWMKTAEMRQCRAYVFLQFADRQVTLGDTSQDASADWTRFAAEYDSGEQDETAQVVLATQDMESETGKRARAWFDDLAVVEGRVGAQSPASVCPLRHGAWAPMQELTDEFEGGALDPKKWQVREFPWDAVKTAYSGKNVSVSGGLLHLALKKEAVAGHPEIAYTSGFVVSQAKARYGYFEARCRLTKALANNAYWFYLADGDRGGLSEIDIFETSAAERTDMPAGIPESARLANKVNTTLHIESPAGPYFCAGTKHWQAPVSLDSGFHRYGLEWNEDHILVYFDGQLIQAFENTHHRYPLTLMFNLTATYGGLPRDADLPSTFDVDYVRAWKRADVEDRRVWEFQFALPDRKQQYRVQTREGGTLVVGTGGNRGYVKVDYLNPDFFRAQKGVSLRKTVEARDKRGKRVLFHFEWRPSVVDTEHAGYTLYRVDMEPAGKRPRGSSETFVFAAENGQDFRLKFTY